MLLSAWIIPKVSVANAQERVKLEGVVTVRESEEPVPYAQVLIKELSLWGFSNDEGKFSISGIIPGTYTLEVVSLGYQTITLPVTLDKNVSNFRVQLREENLKLDDVIVTAKAGNSMNSSSRVDKKAIEHVQATSLADVMQLIPGSLIQNPTLVSENKIAIRSINENENNLRGVGVLINGSKVSSDAGMESDIMDFRSISTDNIESVEVLKGVLSAEYGDVTSGAIIVRTKAGYTPYEVRFKSDPRTKAISFGKGFRLGANKGNLNVNADYASSFTDWRSPVDEFERITLGVTYSNTYDMNGKPLRFNARVSGYHLGNSVTQDPDVSGVDFKEVNKNNISLSMYGNWQLNKSWISTLDYNISGSYAENNKQTYELKDNIPLPTTNRTTDGIGLGYFTPHEFDSDEWINEVPIYFNAKISGNLNKSIGETLLKTKIGVEYNTKGNNGRGVYHEGDVPQYFRERPYSDIPFISDLNAFAEEKVKIPLGENNSSIELMAGVRLSKMIIDGYDYDPTLDPRFNAKYNIIAPKRQGFMRELALRGGWGIMKKLPSIGVLYPAPEYLDNALFQYRNSETGESLALIQTSVIDGRLDYNMDPIRTNNIEIGLDLNIAGVESKFTYFNEQVRDGFTQNSEYVPQEVNYYNSVSDPDAAPKYEDGTIWAKDESGVYQEVPYTTYYQYKGYSRPDNRGAIDKWGIEYDFNFGTIKPINTSVIVNGAYMYTEDYSTGQIYSYQRGQDPIDPQSDNKYYGIYVGSSSTVGAGTGRERLSTNISFVTRIPSIRMIVSLTTQCIWMENNWNIYDQGNIYKEDNLGNPVYGDYDNESNLTTLYRDPIAYVDRNGVTRPFSDYHTTTDNDLKRRLEVLRLKTDRSYYFLENGYNPYFMANIRVTKELGDIASLSFYANNFTNSRPVMKNKARPSATGGMKNTPIYFGAELKLTF
jgi:hypothetical protein